LRATLVAANPERVVDDGGRMATRIQEVLQEEGWFDSDPA
jgi:hypothetical protein